MNWSLLCRNLGLLGMLVGGSMVFSLPWAFPVCGETEVFESRGFWGMMWAILFSVGLGGALYLIGRKEKGTILRKEALAVVGLGWILAGVLGSLPFLFAGTERAADVPMSVADALFESISGFTTTGASVLTELEDPDLVPRCVLFWRSFTHWLGGMGIIVLFVAILGQLGVGGKALMRREVPGPINETVRPRVRETALVMWSIYVGISFVLTVVFLLEDLSLFDAFCHSFGTMATGGFSTYNDSIGHFKSPLIEGTIVVFMIAAGTNFSLYYLILHHHKTSDSKGFLNKLSPLFRDPEYRIYLCILITSTLVLTFSLQWNENYEGNLLQSFRHAAFNTVSIMTTTGYGTEDFHQWSEFAKGLLLLLMFVGGCAGSTGGGLKVVRFLLFQKIIRLEIEQAFRPNVVRPLRIFGRPIESELRHEVIVYFSLVLFLFISSWMILAAIEPDHQWESKSVTQSAVTTTEVDPASKSVTNHKAEKLLDCASAVAATLNNIGPGLGVLGPHSNYSDFSQPGKMLLALLMLLGRLELFAILVLFVPSFWRVQ
jgi:trk system potassium uptake protein TrkH